MLCSFLLYNTVTQPYVHICPLPLRPPSHPYPFLPLYRQRTPSFTAASHQLPVLHVVAYNVSAALSAHLTLSFPHCVHKTVL